MAYNIANILANIVQNKPNGQFMLEFEPAAIKAFTKDLPIRKIPGVGKVNERLLDSIGIKVYLGTSSCAALTRGIGRHAGTYTPTALRFSSWISSSACTFSFKHTWALRRILSNRGRERRGRV